MTMLRFADNTEARSVDERKRELRKRMKTRRVNNENRDVKESLMTEHALSAIETLGKSLDGGVVKSVFCYLSYSSEASTDLLIEKLLALGCKVYCPRVEGSEMAVVEYGDDFTLSPMRIREPVGIAYDGEVDVAITPLLAVDEKGNRLGYGGGYYDRYFAAHPQTKRVAYGYDFQIVDEVPHEETDKTMDCIVTDKRVTWIKK